MYEEAWCRVFLSKPSRGKEAWSFASAGDSEASPHSGREGESLTAWPCRGGDASPCNMFRSRTRAIGAAGANERVERRPRASTRAISGSESSMKPSRSNVPGFARSMSRTRIATSRPKPPAPKIASGIGALTRPPVRARPCRRRAWRRGSRCPERSGAVSRFVSPLSICCQGPG